MFFTFIFHSFSLHCLVQQRNSSSEEHSGCWASSAGQCGFLYISGSKSCWLTGWWFFSVIIFKMSLSVDNVLPVVFFPNAYKMCVFVIWRRLVSLYCRLAFLYSKSHRHNLHDILYCWLYFELFYCWASTLLHNVYVSVESWLWCSVFIQLLEPCDNWPDHTIR